MYIISTISKGLLCLHHCLERNLGRGKENVQLKLYYTKFWISNRTRIQLYSATEIINVLFKAEDLVDMNSVHFQTLAQEDP